MNISLITATGGRPEAFALCQKWMDNQTFAYDEWIIVDDELPRATILPGRNKIHLPLDPSPPGTNTYARNLLTALRTARGSIIAIIEDDDWYPPDYLDSRIYRHKNDSIPLIGKRGQLAYDVKNRRWRRFPHYPLSSITMFRPVLQVLIDACKWGPKYLDVEFAKQWTMSGWGIKTDEARIVSMKNMPGRLGIGLGHSTSPAPWNEDRDLSWLRTLIGNDVKYYEGFYSK